MLHWDRSSSFQIFINLIIKTKILSYYDRLCLKGCQKLQLLTIDPLCYPIKIEQLLNDHDNKHYVKLNKRILKIAPLIYLYDHLELENLDQFPVVGAKILLIQGFYLMQMQPKVEFPKKYFPKIRKYFPSFLLSKKIFNLDKKNLQWLIFYFQQLEVIASLRLNDLNNMLNEKVCRHKCLF